MGLQYPDLPHPLRGKTLWAGHAEVPVHLRHTIGQDEVASSVPQLQNQGSMLYPAHSVFRLAQTLAAADLAS
jgi:hypothetical protein